MCNLSPKGGRQGQKLVSAFSLQLVRLSPVFAVLNVAENKDSPITSVVKSQQHLHLPLPVTVTVWHFVIMSWSYFHKTNWIRYMVKYLLNNVTLTIILRQCRIDTRRLAIHLPFWLHLGHLLLHHGHLLLRLDLLLSLVLGRSAGSSAGTTRGNHVV